MATPSAFALKLAAIAQEQHTEFQNMIETNPKLCKQIEQYYKDIGYEFISCEINAWSAAFVSFCVKKAGATAAEFKFADGHSQFVHKAIQNALNEKGVFHGLEIGAHAPSVGDIIHNNRDKRKYDFAYARTHDTYYSHSAIVVEIGQDTKGRYARTIGGNEEHAIRSKVVRLTKQGFIVQRPNDPFICVIKTLK